MAHNHLNHIENEKKTAIVIIITIITMVAEIFFGLITHSMALLADGCHMGTHALALTITFLAYIFIEKIQNCKNCDLVSEKISAFAGYTSSLFLLATAFWIVYESFNRLFHPLNISFNEAILVAIIGFIVNLICVVIMKKEHKHEHKIKNEDYNFKAAYFHILTDAMTSILAIIALITGKYLGLYILDPIMGFVGGALILRWSIGLIKDTSKILLDVKMLK